MLKSFVVRTYRFGKKKPRTLVGVVEEIGIKGRKAFTNVDELWEIFSSGKQGEKKLKQSDHPDERRNERRISKEIPFVFVHNNRSLDASVLNYSDNGLGIKIFKKIVFPVGNTVTLKAGDSLIKAEIMWVRKKIAPFATAAGLKIVDGSLCHGRMGENMDLTMMRESVTET